MMETLAIIPARGGSKGIPGKNLKRVGTDSLISRSIRCAQKAGIHEVIVSTDNPEIALEAKSCGAKVSIRPPEISGDLASSEDAIQHVIRELPVNQDLDHLKIAFLQATSPFTHSDDLNSALSMVGETQSVFAAFPFHNFLWTLSDSHWNPIGHEAGVRIMRQELPPIVMETGNFYCFNAQSFLSSKSRFCGNPIPFEVRNFSTIQIDTEEDLLFARKMQPLLDSF